MRGFTGCILKTQKINSKDNCYFLVQSLMHVGQEMCLFISSLVWNLKMMLNKACIAREDKRQDWEITEGIILQP